jgi:hypothetical protein
VTQETTPTWLVEIREYWAGVVAEYERRTTDARAATSTDEPEALNSSRSTASHSVQAIAAGS